MFRTIKQKSSDNGPVCGCGQKGCLEAHISSPAMIGRIRRDISSGVTTILSEQIDDTNTDYFAEAIKKKFTTYVYDESSRHIEIIPARAKE